MQEVHILDGKGDFWPNGFRYRANGGQDWLNRCATEPNTTRSRLTLPYIEQTALTARAEAQALEKRRQ